MILLWVINAIQQDFLKTYSFRKLYVQYLKIKCFTGEKESDNTADPHFRRKMRNIGVRSQPVEAQWALNAINEVVKSPTGTSNFHNQYTSVKWILSYPMTSLSSQTKSLQGTLDEQKIHDNLSKWQNKKYTNTNSQKINPNNIPNNRYLGELNLLNNHLCS